MQAKDIMTTPVVMAGPGATVREIARLMVDMRISAIPIVDEGQKILGMVSEGDLVRRAEIGTEHEQKSWWLNLLTTQEELASAFVKTHAHHAKDVMSRPVITVSEDATLQEIAGTMEKRSVKRVPVTREGQIVGIVSRANLVAAIANAQDLAATADGAGDGEIRGSFLDLLDHETWSSAHEAQVSVTDGVITLTGIVTSEDEQEATRVLAEQIQGVRKLVDERKVLPLPTGY